jgi:hypothetical protein
MSELRTSAEVGIIPVGSLGVAFFHHLGGGKPANLGKVGFIERRGSLHGAATRGQGILKIFDDGDLVGVSTTEVCHPDLVASAELGWLPEVLLGCTQPDQLLTTASDYVGLLEWLFSVYGMEEATRRLPVLVLCSNGIYHERVRRFLVELLEESMLYGRLPDLWNGPMARIVGKLLRGVTLQTGHREGTGPSAIYHPGPSGRTILTGGSRESRDHAASLLRGCGAWFEIEDTLPPVRVEFDKALINLWGNLFGQLKAINAQGEFQLLRVCEIFDDPEAADLRLFSSHVFAIGCAVRAYRQDEDFAALHAAALKTASGPGAHIPSSLMWIHSQLRDGSLKAELTPTEKWLLDPLIRFAKTAGLGDSADFFTKLGQRVEDKLQAAILKWRNSGS